MPVDDIVKGMEGWYQQERRKLDDTYKVELDKRLKEYILPSIEKLANVQFALEIFADYNPAMQKEVIHLLSHPEQDIKAYFEIPAVEEKVRANKVEKDELIFAIENLRAKTLAYGVLAREYNKLRLCLPVGKGKTHKDVILSIHHVLKNTGYFSDFHQTDSNEICTMALQTPNAKTIVGAYEAFFENPKRLKLDFAKLVKAEQLKDYLEKHNLGSQKTLNDLVDIRLAIEVADVSVPLYKSESEEVLQEIFVLPTCQIIRSAKKNQIITDYTTEFGGDQRKVRNWVNKAIRKLNLSPKPGEIHPAEKVRAIYNYVKIEYEGERKIGEEKKGVKRVRKLGAKVYSVDDLIAMDLIDKDENTETHSYLNLPATIRLELEAGNVEKARLDQIVNRYFLKMKDFISMTSTENYATYQPRLSEIRHGENASLKKVVDELDKLQYITWNNTKFYSPSKAFDYISSVVKKLGSEKNPRLAYTLSGVVNLVNKTNLNSITIMNAFEKLRELHLNGEMKILFKDKHSNIALGEKEFPSDPGKLYVSNDNLQDAFWAISDRAHWGDGIEIHVHP